MHTTEQEPLLAQLVVAGASTTLHRPECPLVSRRVDLQPAGLVAPLLTACRLCGPDPA